MLVHDIYSSWGFWELGLIAGGMLGFYCVYKVATMIYDELTSPLHNLPGPPSKSWLFGHFKDLFSGVRSNIMFHPSGVS